MVSLLCMDSFSDLAPVLAKLSTSEVLCGHRIACNHASAQLQHRILESVSVLGCCRFSTLSACRLTSFMYRGRNTEDYIKASRQSQNEKTRRNIIEQLSPPTTNQPTTTRQTRKCCQKQSTFNQKSISKEFTTTQSMRPPFSFFQLLPPRGSRTFSLPRSAPQNNLKTKAFDRRRLVGRSNGIQLDHPCSLVALASSSS